MKRSKTKKRFKGVRYSFRPKSYWEESDPLSAILRNITGENRRQMITDFWNAGRLEDLDPTLLKDELDPDTSASLGRIHPSFMGGEFLPGFLSGEVEIARICLRSTTSDVITLRARPAPSGIAYRIADEYDGQFTLPITFSERPLTLLEVIRQFDDGSLDEVDCSQGLAHAYNLLNGAGLGPADASKYLRGFTSIQSRIYRQLNNHFDHVYDEWFKNPPWKNDDEQDGEDDSES